MVRGFDAPSHMRVPLLALAFCLGESVLGAPLDGPAARSSVYSLSTVVVYNTSAAESREIAFAYAKARGIADSQIVALTCPNRESISREEFISTIETPLRSAFIGNGWFQTSKGTSGIEKIVSNRIHVLALIYGIPLRIQNSLPPPEAGDDPESEAPLPGQSPMNQTNAASVDSELCLLADPQSPLKGAVNNPYFDADLSFYQARHPGLMLAGRIDGPSPEAAIRLIRDAIATEKKGLWGYAYIDESKKFQQGDDWLRASAETLAREGVPVVLDRHRARFPLNYPMGHAALYLGWYTEHVDGPFLHPGFRFLPGAIACHLHSTSAATLRSDSKHWAGPLLARGACGVLGNVFEPYLGATHHFDRFTDRLLKGFTLAESAYMAIPTISWMGIVVGDPLYRPYETWNRFDREAYSKDGDSDLKALRLATKRWAFDDPEQFHLELIGAADRLKSGRIYEAMALAASNRGDFDDAALWFQKSLPNFPGDQDRFRVQMHRVDLARRLGRKDEAVSILRQLAGLDGTVLEAKAAAEVLDQLRPPLPPLPQGR